jgi:hypothetical protein
MAFHQILLKLPCLWLPPASHFFPPRVAESSRLGEAPGTKEPTGASWGGTDSDWRREKLRAASPAVAITVKPAAVEASSKVSSFRIGGD